MHKFGVVNKNCLHLYHLYHTILYYERAFIIHMPNGPNMTEQQTRDLQTGGSGPV
jgi:hypothetical protein